MPSGNRRIPRPLRSSIPAMMAGFGGDTTSRYPSLGGGVPTLPVLEQAAAPKHFPFPNTPVDDDLFFEGLMFLFTTVCGALQFLHLYRTVWWLPHSYNRQAVNFYLIDINLVTFIIILLSRRLIYIVGCRVLDRIVSKPKFTDLSITVYRLTLFGVVVTVLSWCAYEIMQSHPFVNILYLCYPVLVYLILFGCQITPFFELVTWNASAMPPLHACRSNAAEVRQEVENLRTNFNSRVKQILFSSILNAYYAGFIPCCFSQNHIHYDIYWASQHVIFIFLSSFTASTSHILSLRYCDILHRSALHLGTWYKLETRNMLLVNNSWNEETLWPYGALVKHGRDLYRALGECNASEPGNPTYSRFYSLFRNPSNSLCCLSVGHGVMVMLQLALLFYTILWHNVISITFLLFFNYYVLYKLGRDCLVSMKMYEEERAMHNKINLR